MKKILLVLITSALFVGCGNKTEETEQITSEEITEVEVAKTENMIGGEEKGEGKVYLENESGTTENNNIIWIKNDDYQLLQIGITTEGMDGSKETVIYIDGKEHSVEQFSDTQSVLELTSDQLSPGVHNVEVVQGDSFYKLMKYEVK